MIKQHVQKSRSSKITRDAEEKSHKAKTYRLRDEAVEAINAKRIKLIVERKEDVKESDLLGALIWKHLSTLTAQDVKAYREQVLGKD
ncbi:hypothetical protein [Pseudomonas aeruginosa]|uniref:hypothetical protein n=1 Tax=Pseudomonas aeruginosa TaxID=287 RepID=UPI001C71658F|nr:hypothetical protein [Pseudomonas aeruginosa]